MKLAFADFWPGFQPDHNFFLYLFQDMYDDVKLVTPEMADVLIYSCFGGQHGFVNRADTFKIFYTGENLRPNYQECDMSISFDFDTYAGRNVRLPLWMLQIDWFNKVDYENPKYVLPLQDIEENEFTQKPKTKFCTTVYNNPAPHRVEMYEKLSKYKQVDGFGTPFGNWFYGEGEKYKIISDYKFSICFENSMFPGYYTEKLFHAKTAGTVPIYWADEYTKLDFNENSFINLHDFESIDELVKHIEEVDKDEDLYLKYFTEPLFRETPSLDQVKFGIRRILDSQI